MSLRTRQQAAITIDRMRRILCSPIRFGQRSLVQQPGHRLVPQDRRHRRHHRDGGQHIIVDHRHHTDTEIVAFGPGPKRDDTCATSISTLPAIPSSACMSDV